MDGECISGTLLGCLPNNFVAVSAGSRLGELQSLQDLYDIKLLLLGRYSAQATACMPAMPTTLQLLVLCTLQTST